jgi:hypothetical protein
VICVYRKPGAFCDANSCLANRREHQIAILLYFTHFGLFLPRKIWLPCSTLAVRFQQKNLPPKSHGQAPKSRPRECR